MVDVIVKTYMADATRAPLSNCSVTLNGYGETTAADGTVTFLNVPYGTYQLSASKSQYYTITMELVLNEFSSQPEYIELPMGKSCFIATAVYGSPHASQLVTLRNFRDNFMLATALGHAFVRIYYAVSPSIANFIRGYPRLRFAIRILLDPIVAKLRKKK